LNSKEGQETPKHFWQEISNCRAFFDTFALEMGFDPSVEDNWYSVEMATLRKKKASVLIFVV